MKMFTRAVVILAILMIFLYFITVPTLKKLTGCISKQGDMMEQSMVLREQENWSRQKFCEEEVKIVNQSVSCYKKVESESLFSSEIYFKLIGKKQTAQDMLTKHNQSCAEYPKTLIK